MQTARPVSGRVPRGHLPAWPEYLSWLPESLQRRERRVPANFCRWRNAVNGGTRGLAKCRRRREAGWCRRIRAMSASESFVFSPAASMAAQGRCGGVRQDRGGVAANARKGD
jgi:hypothetical protein